MKAKRCLFTFIFIAASALSTWATAENVYKCGSTYSQSPCPGAKVLSVDDSRDPAQKKLKDEITRRDAELAGEMEKTRLAREEALAAERAQEAKNAAQAKKAKAKPVEPVEPVEPVIIYAHKPHLIKPHKPDGFKAVVPDTVRKTKKSRKKTSDSEL